MLQEQDKVWLGEGCSEQGDEETMQSKRETGKSENTGLLLNWCEGSVKSEGCEQS